MVIPVLHIKKVSLKGLINCPALCDPVDCSPPGSSVHGMFQARILESVPLPPSRGCFQHREGTCTSASPALAGGFFTTVPSGNPACLLSLLRSVVGNRIYVTLLLTGQFVWWILTGQFIECLSVWRFLTIRLWLYILAEIPPVWWCVPLCVSYQGESAVDVS